MITLGVSGHWGLSPFFFLEPTVAVTPFGRRSSDDALIVRVFTGSVRAGGRLGPLLVAAGPGYLVEWMKGPGGTVTLNNGTSTKEFALPGRSLLARALTLDASVGALFGPMRVDFTAWVLGLLSKRRELTLGVQVGYGFL